MTYVALCYVYYKSRREANCNFFEGNLLPNLVKALQVFWFVLLFVSSLLKRCALCWIERIRIGQNSMDHPPSKELLKTYQIKRIRHSDMLCKQSLTFKKGNIA